MHHPTYQHPCKGCLFLGTYKAEHHWQDLYFCGDPGHGTIVVVRNNDPEDTFGYRPNCIEAKGIPEPHRAMFEEGLEIAKSKGLL